MYIGICLVFTGKRALYILIKRGDPRVSCIANPCSVYQILVLISLKKSTSPVWALWNTIWENELKFQASFRDVLNHCIQALQYNNIQDINCAPKMERQQIQQKESGMLCLKRPAGHQSLSPLISKWNNREKKNEIYALDMHSRLWKTTCPNPHKRYLNMGGWLLQDLDQSPRTHPSTACIKWQDWHCLCLSTIWLSWDSGPVQPTPGFYQATLFSEGAGSITTGILRWVFWWRQNTIIWEPRIASQSAGKTIYKVFYCDWCTAKKEDLQNDFEVGQRTTMR